MRSALVTALVACADRRRRNRSLRFLEGLSSDELQYIAEYLGACTLESMGEGACTRAQLAAQVSSFQQLRAGRSRAGFPDQDHKTILLFEYLSRSGHRSVWTPVRTARPA